MEIWKKKILIDSAKAVLPFQRQLRLIKRRLSPYKDNRNNSLLALRQGLDQILMLRKVGMPIDGVVLEFGTGWVPVIPLLFHLAGAKKVILTDIEHLMDSQTKNIAKTVILENIDFISDILGIKSNVALEKISSFFPEYIVPWKTSDTPEKSIDIIISRAVFEHIPPHTIESLFPEFRRMISTAGAMCHIVDNSDHSEHHDKSISRVNFLRYELDSFWWKLLCFNQQNYQNRLRHSDYIKLLENSDWNVEISTGQPDPQAVEALSTMPLAKQYREKDIHDLAILTSCFIARPRF